MDDTITIDDTSSEVHYEGAWILKTDAKGAYNSTTHGMPANTQGTITFKFVGSSVAVYGTIPIFIVGLSAEPYKMTASVDNGLSSTYTPKLLADVQLNVLHYRAQDLSNGEHTLRIVASVPLFGAPFRLDYIQYTPSDKEVPVSSPIPPPVNQGNTVPTSTTAVLTSQSTTITSLSALTTSNISMNPNGSSTSSSSQQSNSSNISTNATPSQGQFSTGLPSPTSFPPTSLPSGAAAQGAGSKQLTGAIVGSVLGGILLCTIAFALFFWWRRRTKGISPSPSQHLMSSTNVVQPFTTAQSASLMPDKASRNVDPPGWSSSAYYSDGRDITISRSELSKLLHPDSSSPPQYQEHSKSAHARGLKDWRETPYQ